MIKKELGKKKYLKMREVFETEDKDFTPWLNDHLDMLSEELDIDIIDSNVEEGVGDFSCDIVAKDSDTKQTIIIENQFGTTDHDHLGKIFTYGAGKNAKIIIWIAEKFREEHKKTLEWLNENIDPTSGVSFFGIAIKLIQIEDSPKVAPDFNVIVKPNTWERNIKISGTQPASDTNKKYLDFFTELVDEYSKINPGWRKLTPLPQSWLGFGAGKSGLAFNWSFRGNNRISVELYIDTGDKNENEIIFDGLLKNKTQIDNDIKGLSWEKLEDKRACRIAVYRNISYPIKTLPKIHYPDILDWATTTMKQFSHVFSDYLKKL